MSRPDGSRRTVISDKTERPCVMRARRAAAGEGA
jgi:hypothetical protein